MRTIMVLLLLLVGIVPAHGATDCDPPDCPVVVDAIDGPVHESADSYTADSYTADSYTADSYTADSYTADSYTADSYTAELKLRNGPAQQNVEVAYRFVDGTAKQGEDYAAAPHGTVTIKAGASRAGVPYEVLRVTGEQKKFTLEITSVKPGQIGKRVAVFTIAGRR